jgi:transposase
LKLVAQIRALTRQAKALQRELETLVARECPQLLAERGCGTLTTATIIGRVAGAERFATDSRFARQAGTAPIPASSGRRDRHRYHRGGDRQLNRALQTIAVTRARIDPETKAYLARKRSEGKSNREAIRSLKRHLARRIWRLLQPAETQDNRAMTIQCNLPRGKFALT